MFFTEICFGYIEIGLLVVDISVQKLLDLLEREIGFAKNTFSLRFFFSAFFIESISV